KLSGLTRLIANFRLNAKILEAIAEDFRKIGVTLFGVGAAGFILSNDNISTTDSIFLICCGTIVWNIGIIFTYISSRYNLGDTE
ncbi:hypothetical protein A1D23_13225, partial [Chelonobacter oris]|uniref:hypothetical protein n=1 Tax=Chelonobacter oris TaxID=505317 RepID=UPI0024479ADA